MFFGNWRKRLSPKQRIAAILIACVDAFRRNFEVVVISKLIEGGLQNTFRINPVGSTDRDVGNLDDIVD